MSVSPRSPLRCCCILKQLALCVIPASSSSPGRIRLFNYAQRWRGCKVEGSEIITPQRAPGAVPWLFKEARLWFLVCLGSPWSPRTPHNSCQFAKRQLGLLLTPGCLIQAFECMQNNQHRRRGALFFSHYLNTNPMYLQWGKKKRIYNKLHRYSMDWNANTHSTLKKYVIKKQDKCMEPHLADSATLMNRERTEMRVTCKPLQATAQSAFRFIVSKNVKHVNSDLIHWWINQNGALNPIKGRRTVRVEKRELVSVQQLNKS